jgi:hypothetical protein
MTEADRINEITKLQLQFKELDDDAYEKNPDLAQERGRQFEKLVRDVFEAWGLLVRGSYHTGDNRSEQIDGVIKVEGRYALLEAKWTKANLAASELFSFLGKVEGKFTGTIGVFISRNELTSNFLTALRAGRRQTILVIHGHDVDDLFNPMFDLPGYLSRHVLHVCMDNLCHLSTERYLTMLKTETLKNGVAVGGNVVEEKIELCLTQESAKNIANEYAEDLSASQRIDAVQRIVTDYADITSAPGGDDAWRGENLQEFLKELIERLPNNVTQAETTFFGELSQDYQNSHYRRMTRYFAPRYEYLSTDNKVTCEQRLTRQWDKIIGEWMSENRLAESTRPLWDHLRPQTKKHLIGYFVEFVLSNRGMRHEQYQLADFALKKEDSVPAAMEALLKHAKEAAKTLLEDGDTELSGEAKMKKAVMSAMRSMQQYIPEFEKTVSEAVAMAITEHMA